MYKLIKRKDCKMFDKGNCNIFIDDKPKCNNVCKSHKPKHTISINTPNYWDDLYTDASGNCYSDADSGL